MLPYVDEKAKKDLVNPLESYGIPGCFLLYFIRVLALLSLPQYIFIILGLTFYNAFPSNIKLKGKPPQKPLICIRVITRGNYPKLVQDNVVTNMKICSKIGLENFLIEVVTEKSVGLLDMPRVREIILPPSYKPKNGALFKARALQYCLEDEINILENEDYIVHLDEETVISADAARGIVNFVLENKHDFGQGLITYTNGEVVNWFTTLADASRVADDMGKIRAQFSMLHKPVFSWKGSFIVAKVSSIAFFFAYTCMLYYASEIISQPEIDTFVTSKLKNRS